MFSALWKNWAGAGCAEGGLLYHIGCRKSEDTSLEMPFEQRTEGSKPGRHLRKRASRRGDRECQGGSVPGTFREEPGGHSG